VGLAPSARVVAGVSFKRWLYHRKPGAGVRAAELGGNSFAGTSAWLPLPCPYMSLGRRQLDPSGQGPKTHQRAR
jgi:hypothetical protein